MEQEQIALTPDDWRTAWPKILAREGWACLKQGRNGSVHRSIVRLGEYEVDVVVKNPRRSRPSQWVTDCCRPNRARRSWYRTRRVVANGFTAEIPLLLAERRLGGVGPLAVEQLAVFLAVPGTKLDALNLEDVPDRQGLFRSVGTTMAELACRGFEHRDAKAPNWIVCGSTPVLIDCDAITAGRDPFRGFKRFLRSFELLRNPTRADVEALCEGFSLFAVRERWPAATTRLVDETRRRYGRS